MRRSERVIQGRDLKQLMGFEKEISVIMKQDHCLHLKLDWFGMRIEKESGRSARRREKVKMSDGER